VFTKIYEMRRVYARARARARSRVRVSVHRQLGYESGQPRALLEKTIEAIWKRPEFAKIREEYAKAAGHKTIPDTYGAQLKTLMQEGRAGVGTYADAAKAVDLGGKYLGQWPRVWS